MLSSRRNVSKIKEFVLNLFICVRPEREVLNVSPCEGKAGVYSPVCFK